MRKITTELQDTLRHMPDIEAVYFDRTGRHYFNIFKLMAFEPAEGEDPVFKAYGQGEFSHMQVIPGKTNIDNLREAISRGVKGTEIIDSMSREEVLDFEVKPVGDGLTAQFLNSSPEDQAAFLAVMRQMMAPAQVTEAPEVPKGAAKPPKGQ